MKNINYEMAANHILEGYTHEEVKENLKAVKGSFYNLVSGGCFLVYNNDIEKFLKEVGASVRNDMMDNFRAYGKILEIAYKTFIE